MQVGLVGQRGRERAVEITATLRERLLARGVEVLVDESTATALDVPGTPTDRLPEADLAVSVGGDGTFLYAARAVDTTPIVGVNLGEVGFLNAVSPSSAVEEVLGAVDDLAAGELRIREVPRLRVEGPVEPLAPAVNEVLLQGPRRGAGATTELSIAVDGSTYLEGVADGVLVATPTGSTAYNLSEGGPLLHPTVEAMVVTPMFPRTETRPVVVDPEATVELTLSGVETGHVVTDGRAERTVEAPATFSVAASDRPLRLAGPELEFFEALGKLE